MRGFRDGGRRVSPIGDREREAKGTKCNLDKAVSLLTSPSRPLKSVYILYYIVYVLYVHCILYM